MGSVILSLCLGGGKLGAAYYEEDTEMIRILHDISEDHNDLRLVNSLVRQVAPTVVLVSTRQDERLLIFLKESCVWDRARAESEAPQKYHARKESLITEEEEEEPVDTNEDEQEEVDAVARTALHLMPNSSFSYEDAKRRLAALLGDESKNDTENQLTVAYRLNLDCVSMIRSMGALLKYIDVLRIGVEFEDLSVKTPISGIRSFTLEEMVEMDECTYKALQIFHEDNHPSVFKAGKSGGSKEGLSLFGICNRCRSSPGKVELRRWFQRPIVNRDVLRKRQAAVSFFLQDCNLDLTGAIHSSLKYVKNLSGIFKRMKSSQASVGDWISLYRTCYYMVHIASLLKSREVRKELLDELVGAIGEEVALTVAILGELADFQEMQVEDRFVVKRGVDRELDAKKDALSKLPETMSIIAHQELNDTLGQWVSTCAVVYLPMVGYLITVPKKPEWNTMEDCDPIPGVEFIFMSNDKVHYKNARMLQLDAELGDVTFQIIDMETSMMLRLQKQILERSRALLHAVRAAALIDCLVSLALTAREHDWRRPELVDDPIIDVARARHPLVELVTSPFIPNPIRSGGNDTKMKVLTGSNASGKSIYLKQVGIVVFLAHLGSFVPAEKARIGPFDRIFSRMHTIDSVLDGLSTFAKDLLQMSVALRRATGNSLVIVDEFGKGTMTEVGLSLLTASLNYWLRCGKASCPHVVVSSHLHAVIDLLDDDQNIISYHTMEVLRVGSELEFQFRLVEGTVDCSYAAYTAMKAGIPMHVVERGYDVYQALKTGDPIIKRNTTEIEWGQQYQRLKAVVDFFLAWDLEEDDPIELLEHVASFASVDERNATEPIEEEQVNQEEPEDDEHSSPDQVASSL